MFLSPAWQSTRLRAVRRRAAERGHGSETGGRRRVHRHAFGLTGGASYTKSSIKPNPGGNAEDLPGYSKWVINGTLFFEKGGFNLRGSMRYRSTFVGEVSGFAANRTRRRAAPETIVDAQIGYDFQEGSMLQGLSLYIQGQNLTNEPFVTYNPSDARQVIDYQDYGRRFLAGFTYKF